MRLIAFNRMLMYPKLVVILLLSLAFRAYNCAAQSYDLGPDSKDTINYTDKDGRKQGRWISYGSHRPGSCYAPNQKAEEGEYLENRKSGIWVEYYCNGQMRNKITFVNGKPEGYAVVYYENGKIQEEGQWKNNRWVGGLKQYYDNGQIQHDFKFNENGRRDGTQTYKHANGQVAVQGNFTNGKEDGTLNEYNEKGELKAQRTFEGGAVDVASIKTYSLKENAKKPEMLAIVSKEPAKVEEKSLTEEKQVHVLNGRHTLYDRNKQVTKDGIFSNNTFIEGKAYIYNDNGILTRIAIYKNGQYVGDGIVED